MWSKLILPNCEAFPKSLVWIVGALLKCVVGALLKCVVGALLKCVGATRPREFQERSNQEGSQSFRSLEIQILLNFCACKGATLLGGLPRNMVMIELFP